MKLRYLRLLFYSVFFLGINGLADTPAPRSATDPSGIVKEIRTDNLKRTKREIVIRELESKVGEPYSELNVKKDIQRLDRLGIFSEIKIEAEKEAGGVVLDIRVKETLPYLPAPSFDSSDEDGFTVGGSFRAPNLGGRDISLATSARFGNGTTFEVMNENPWFWGNHGSYLVQYYYRDRYNKLYESQENSHDFILQMGSYVRDKGRIGGRFELYSVRADTPGVTLSPEGRDTIPTLGLYLGYDSRDVWAHPQKGWWGELEIAKNGGFLGGLSDFWSFTLDVRRYQPLFEKHSLAFFSLSTYRTGTIGQTFPVHQYFQIGGSNTIRGWSSNSQYGKSQFINTAEYRYLLMKPRAFSFKGINFYLGLQLAAFGDFGMAWDQGSQFHLDNFISGYGFGLRLLLPFIDAIRFDFAFGESGEGMNSHIALGRKPPKQRARVR